MSATNGDWIVLVGDEARVHQSRYEELAKKAEEMGDFAIAKFLRAVIAAETARVKLYLKYLAELKPLETQDYYICPQCGVALTVTPPKECPLCHTPGTQFENIA